jgi:NADH-quinone oxidoreductase subunit I
MIKENEIIIVNAPKLSVAERFFGSAILGGLLTTLKHFFRRKITVQYPETKRPLKVSNQRAFHRLNLDANGRVKCVACMMCETICPARCIHIVAAPAPWPDREKYPERFVIDELRCIYCGMCEQACPVAAIELTQIFDPVSSSRDEMLYDVEKLLENHQKSVSNRPQRIPPITGYEQEEKIIR